jgi:hypothetical protein
MQNKIIINWMYPRSLSTVFMRAVSNRGDFETVFEPFLPLYWGKHKEQKGASHKDYEGWPTEYDAIKQKIYTLAEKSNVFIKECAFHALDKFLADDEFLKRCSHMFQIRDPKRCVLSSWKVRGTQKRQLQELSVEASFKICEKLSAKNLHFLDRGKTPLVIDGEDFQNNPEGIMRAWCKVVGIEFKPEAMKWEQEWRSEYSHWEACYFDVAGSKGVQKNMEAFLYDERLLNAIFEDLPLLKMVYEYHMPFHEKLYKYRLKPIE